MISRIMLVATLAALQMIMPAMAQAPDAKTKAQAEIWKLENEIYQGRAKAGLKFYLSHVAPDYMGWPPQAPKPLDNSGLKTSAPDLVDNNKEKLTMEPVGFTLEGDTGIIYYQTHRTMLADGTAVDQRFEVIHVWKRNKDTWNIVGAMARATPKR